MKARKSPLAAIGIFSWLLVCATAADAATISVSPTPVGGYVTSSPGGLDCGGNPVRTTCTSGNITAGTSVILTAHPDAGCSFVQWTVTGLGTSSTNPLPAFLMPPTAVSGSATFQCAPVFTSAIAATFQTSTPGTFSVTASGVPAPTYSLTAGGFPAGVVLASNGTLSGTPGAAAGGVYPVTITASNGVAPAATQSFSLTVNQPPAITSGPAPFFGINTFGTFTATATGYPAPTFSYTAGTYATLPSGLTLAPNGTISGAPALGTVGSGTIILTAANGVGSPATQAFAITVQKANQTIIVAEPPGLQLTTTASFLVTMIFAAPLPVTIAVDPPSVCSISGIMVSIVGVEGVCMLTATQAGDSNYNAAAPVSFPVPVQPPRYIATIAGNGTLTYAGDGVPAVLAGLGGPNDVAVDTAGNVYIADWFGHRVRRVDAVTGNITTVAGNGLAGFAGDGGPATFATMNQPSTVALDASGNLYIADMGNARIRKVDATTGLITTVAGNGSSTYAGENVAATSVGLLGPTGVEVDASGNLYIAETMGHRIRKVTSGGVITTFAGTGTAGFSGDGGAATDAQLNEPVALAFDAGVGLLIVDMNNRRVRKVSGGLITTVAGNGAAVYNGDGIAATTASLVLPWGVAVGAGGHIFIADESGNRVRRVDAATGLITTVAGLGNAGSTGDGGLATNANLRPSSISIDTAGYFYVAQYYEHVVRKFGPSSATTTITSAATTHFNERSPGRFKVSANGFPPPSFTVNSGVLPAGVTLSAQGVLSGTPAPGTVGSFNVTVGANSSLFPPPGATQSFTLVVDPPFAIDSVAGNGTAGFAGDGGPALSALLGGPVGIARDAAGNLFFADRGNHRLRRIDAVTGIITTVAGTGADGFSGDGGPATLATLSLPTLLALDAAGNLYFSDVGTGRVRRIAAATGTIVTVAGDGGTSYVGEGVAATAVSLNGLAGLALDASGNLYIAEYGAHRIRRVSGGIITTFAGNGTAAFAGDWGLATAASFNTPVGLALDANENLFVTEFAGHRVRMISGGYIRTVAGNGTFGSGGDGGLATSAQLEFPQTVRVASNGDLHIGARRVRKVDRVTGIISLVAGGGTGTPGAGDRGLATDAITFPSDIVVAANGDIYSTEFDPPKIRRIAPAQPIAITSAASTTFGYSQAGTFTMTATGFPRPTYSTGGTLPVGVTLSADGVLSGTPTMTGVFTFTVLATTGLAPADAQVFTLTVRAQQVVMFGTVPTVVVGGTGTVNATASSSLVVTYSTASPTCSVNANSGLVTGISAGTCTIVAAQAGDANYLPAQASVDMSIGKAGQSIAFGAAPSVAVGGTGTVSATATSGLPVAYSTASPTCSVNASSGLVTGISAGACTIAANQAGNANYNAAPQVTQGITVGKANQAITFGTAPTIIFGGTGTVSATGGASGNAVTFTSTTTGICSVSGATVTGLAAGTCTIAANQAGDATYNAAPQVTQGIAVGKASQAITFGTAPTIHVGRTGTVSATGGASGNPVTFSSTTTGICSISGNTVAGLAAGTCTIAANQAGSGNYNAAPQVTQSFAIAAATSIPRLANISTRGRVLTDNDVMIGGFVIGGASPKKVLITARGPSLTAFGVAGAMANPTLQIFSGQTVIATNDDWGTEANAAEITASGIAPGNALESALLMTLNAGPYTAIVSGAAGGTGVGIVEVFEMDHPEIPLINISTRGQVQTDDNVMIGGFIIYGDSPQTVLITARGPSLVPFGITNALANPSLRLFSGQTLIASNDDFGTAVNLTQIQATGVAPTNPLESAILITLNPGAYTAIVNGVGGGTGVGIVEVFAR